MHIFFRDKSVIYTCAGGDLLLPLPTQNNYNIYIVFHYYLFYYIF